jgi:CSLREA domain-containing protein
MDIFKISFLRVWLALSILITVLGVETSAQSGAVFFVDRITDTGDTSPGDGACVATGGGCTLRAAIQEANALPGVDEIRFAIGSGPQTIAVNSALPAVTAPAIIDGSTQPGFSGRPLIELNGAAVSSDGLTVTGGGTTIRGLVINRFGDNGVVLRTGGGNVLETNIIGLDQTGTVARGNATNGVLVESANNRIGGTTPAKRNIVSANNGKAQTGGIKISGPTASGNIVQGNYVGTDITGMADLGNFGRGITMDGASNNIIGGPEAGAGNLVSGNWATGIRMIRDANGNLVQGNLIGVNATVTGILLNDRGVQIRGGSNNQVIGNAIIGNGNDGVLVYDGATDNTIAGNVIAYNGFGPYAEGEDGYSGIWIWMATGARNRIQSNVIFGNAGFGIDIGYMGLATNDIGDVDGFQNSPAFSSATRSAATTTIAGSLSSKPNTQFTIQLFANPQCDSTGYGEGLYAIGQFAVSTNQSGSATINVALPFVLPAGWAVSGTTMDPEGNTSEFSACVIVR